MRVCCVLFVVCSLLLWIVVVDGLICRGSSLLCVGWCLLMLFAVVVCCCFGVGCCLLLVVCWLSLLSSVVS